VSPLASIIVLTHDRPILLRHSVASALAQTVSDVEVLILGDGVTEAVRESATALAADPRVRFLDYPKGPHRGEIHRDSAIREATSNAIFYLCDDDLLLPTHVESLLDLLATHTFVQSKNCWVDEAGEVRPYVADLSSPETIGWHLRDDIRYNAVSVTGTAHRRDFYLEADQPWSATPAGQWPDHFEWKKLFAQPGFSGATSSRVTALQFPNTASDRAEWTEEQRVAELERWEAIIAAPDGEARVEQLYNAGALRYLESVVFAERSRSLEAERLLAALGETQTALDTVLGSTSWRITAPLRRLRALGRRAR
jgi:hypothetical protein